MNILFSINHGFVNHMRDCIKSIIRFKSSDGYDGNYILACTHVRSFLTSVNLRRLGIEEKCPYVNSGVMLMNLDILRNVQDFHEVEQFVELHKNDLTLPDQDIITALYGQHVGIIDSLKYNLSDRVRAFYNSTPGNYKIDLDWIQNNTVIIHYCGRQKPWNKNYVGVLDRFYKQIVR